MNDNNNDDEKVVDLFTARTGGHRMNPQPPQGFAPPELSQDDYRFTLVNKASKEIYTVEKTGHLVVTGANVVLFDSHQEMIWGIPNDEAVVSFERLHKDVSEEKPSE